MDGQVGSAFIGTASGASLVGSRPTAAGMLDQKVLFLERRLKATRILADLLRNVDMSPEDEQAVWSLLGDLRT